jgi:hypothetical protein
MFIPSKRFQNGPKARHQVRNTGSFTSSIQTCGLLRIDSDSIVRDDRRSCRILLEFFCGVFQYCGEWGILWNAQTADLEK